MINLGVSGYSTDQELLVLEAEAWRYHPNDVLLMFYYNDVMANGGIHMPMLHTNKPMFVLDGPDNLKLTNIPVPPPARTGWRRMRLYDLVKFALRSNHGVARLLSSIGLGPGPAGAELPFEELDAYRTDETPPVKNAWSLTQALLRRMKRESEEHGARLLVFYVPARVELSGRQWMQTHSPANYAPCRVATKLGAICGAEGICCIDPTESYRRAWPDLYYPQDPHWTAAGHRLAARILAGDLAQEGCPR